MSDYTMKLRDLVKMLLLPKSYISFYDIITNGATALFNFDFPIFDENHKLELEKKIISHYYMREIGTETPEIFVYSLYSKMNEIMPKYNALYKSQAELYDIDLLSPMNESEIISSDKTANTTENGNTVGANSTTQENKNNEESNSTFNETINNNTSSNTTENENTISSDLPQINFTGTDYGTNSTSRNLSGNQTGENTTTGNNTTNNVINATQKNTTTSSSNMNVDNSTAYGEKNNITRTRKGLNGSKSQSELIIEYQSAVLNIDEMIIDELATLFMCIY